MTTNREWLYALDVADLTDWFDAEHVDNDADARINTCNKSGENVTDSRYKLESDIHRWLTSHVAVSVYAKDVEAEVYGWLDRQAAITEAEGFKKALSLLEGRDSHIAELQAKLDYLEGHGVEIVDAVAGGYEVYNEWYRKAQELEEAMAMDSRIRAQQSDAVDNLAKQRDELLAQVERLEKDKRIGWECECKLQAERDVCEVAYKQANAERKRYSEQIDELRAERDALADDLAECMKERDSLEHDLSETEAEFAKEMAETLSLHSKQQAASHQAWVDAADERDYWKQEVQFCIDAAYPPSHAPDRPYDPRVMAYPDREGCTTPSTLVSAMIDGLRDDVRDTVMPIIEESANAKADCERWREACGSMMDVAHEIERIMDSLEGRALDGKAASK